MKKRTIKKLLALMTAAAMTGERRSLIRCGRRGSVQL